MTVEVIRKFGEDTLMDVNSLEFLDVGNKVINKRGEWIVEGKVVEIMDTKTVSGIFNKKQDTERKYNIRYILRLVK